MSDANVPGGGYESPTEPVQPEGDEPEFVPDMGEDTPVAATVPLWGGQWDMARRMHGTFHEGRMRFEDADDATKEAWLRVAGTHGNCEAKLANLEKAIEGIQTRMSAMVDGVNLLGTQYNTFVEFLTNFQQQMSQGGGIMGMMKAMRGGR